MALDQIKITKAKVHNLKDINVTIPKNTLTVITGPSGSGKSSLAFDTIYVEGQRRYIESLSSYARQFLGQFQPPDVESITGLSPAIAIDQKTSSKNPRSTVGTVTEIYDYLRVLYARVGTLYCPETGDIVRKWTPTQITKELLKLKEGAKIQLLAPISLEKKPTAASILKLGFARCRINGEIVAMDEKFSLGKKPIDSLEIVVDRIILKEGIDKRLNDSIEQALKIGSGLMIAWVDEKEELNFSEHNMSPKIKKIYPDLEPPLFSFNSPLGACPDCNGLGEMQSFEKNLLLVDPELSIFEGAIPPLAKRNSFLFTMVQEIAKHEWGVKLNKPYKSLPESFKKILWEGSSKVFKYSFKSKNSTFEFYKSFPGIIKWFNKKYMETSSEKLRKELDVYRRIKLCPSCNGLRLNPVALATKIDDFNIMDISSLSIWKAYEYFNGLKLEGERAQISKKLVKEIESRLKFLIDVGLGYLTINRAAMTLSGGESQRIRLATQIGSALTGVLYVLDEPSIGLHQRDNQKLINTLKSLRDLGNTVLVVEHDEETMFHADHIIDMGPGAGVHGGTIVAEGTYKEILKNKKSKTAAFLNGTEKIELPASRKIAQTFLEIKGAHQNNIKNLNVKIPLHGVVAITGVSGSGKSTLINEILVPAIMAHLYPHNRVIWDRDNYKEIKGLEKIDSVIEIDQNPIGRTPKSNPATYTGIFTDIRDLFSSTPESKMRGYKPGRFSFNVKGGRCEECEGNGVKSIEMHFLPDVFITCTECRGTRYNRETLSITYKGKNIAEVLSMSIEEAAEFFKVHPRLHRILSTLNGVGLGYMSLGQSATTLSGGEAQRLKLSTELGKRAKGHCFYILDEPTTGLHFSDIKMLLKSLHELVELGHTVLVIEHNLDVIKTADYVIDLGPEGGDAGGNIVAQGTPEEVAANPQSATGKFLKKIL